MLPKRIQVLMTALVFALAFCPVSSLASGENQEAYLAEASAAYQGGDYAAALSALDKALKLNSTDPQALELLALTLKSQNRLNEALKIYRSLIQLAKLENWPESRRAPYVFESAVIEFSQGQFRRSAVDFLAARKAGFNADAAMFFQGLCRYREGDRKGADKIWKSLETESKTPEITAAALYYRARVALDEKSNAEAGNLLRRAAAAADGQKSELAVQIRGAAAGALSDSSRTHFLAGIETLSEYDSNALLLSDELRLTSGETSTFRQTLVAALAAGRDRGDEGAWHLAFRSIVNYNARKETKSGEFAANELDGAWMFAKLGSLRAGPIARGLALFRNESASGGEDFHTYLFSGSGGLAAESFAGENIWRVEASAGNARFLDDADMDPEMRRTGLTGDAALSWRRDRGDGRFNPFARAEAVKQWTAGPEYRGRHARLTVGNRFYLGKWTLIAQGSAGLSDYPERPAEKRQDKIYAFDALAARQVSGSLAFLVRLGLAANLSSLDELYSYRREIAGLGIRYVF
jgi:tetratricopeptide (TPR) repeat protein